jgi:steroid 5-alpha reductase family enzyme
MNKMEKNVVKNIIQSIITHIVVLGIATGLTFAGSFNGYIVFAGLPLFALCIIIAFVIQWIAFIPSYIFKTERFFDITGTIAYITVIIVAVIVGPPITLRTGILLGLVLVWTSRLGFFLFRRVLKVGEDKRFEEIKVSFVKFLQAWTLQGLWVSFTLAAALAVITIDQPSAYSKYDWAGLIIGLVIWIIGFSFEAIADYQKNKFRSVAENKGKFIKTGLWSISRHPNYFGEITIWIGVALIALPSLEAWRYVTLISPVFVFLLITFISGIPLLEKRADEKWGGQEDYEEYKRNTPVLIPKLRFKK